MRRSRKIYRSASATIFTSLILLTLLFLTLSAPAAAESQSGTISASGPSADAGGPYLVDEGSTITLDGSESEGNIENYSWTIVDDPTGRAYLTDADEENAIFHAPEVSQHENVTVELIVEYGEGDWESDSATVMIRDLLVADPGGPYQAGENETITLDASDSSGQIESYSWVIVDDPTGEAHLTDAGQESATFHAPPDVRPDENVVVRLTVLSDENSDSATTVVTVSDLLVADPGGPYSSDEGENLVLDGGESSGSDGSDIVEYGWTIIDDPTGDARLTDTDNERPTFHAPAVDGDKETTIKLTVTDGNGKSSSATTEIVVIDLLVADAGSDVEINEGENIELDGSNSSGDIADYTWAIVEDPTGEAMLNGSDTPTPTFHSPPQLSESENIRVRLTVANGTRSDSDTIIITVVAPPNPPQTLEIGASGKVTDPVPTLPSIYSGSTPGTKAQIQVGTEENENDMWDLVEENLSVWSGSEFDITYGGSLLIPGGTYYWRMRYFDGGAWGDWSVPAAFTMGSMKSIVENGVEAKHTRKVAEIILQIDPSEAAEALKKADPTSSGKVMEEVLSLDATGRNILKVLKEMSAEVRVIIVIEISNLPSTPKEAAALIDLMPLDMASGTVQVMVEREEFGVLDDIFYHLSPQRINDLFGSLSESERADLYPELSTGIKEKISSELKPGGTNWLLLGGALSSLIAAVVFGLVLYSRWMGGERSAKRAQAISEKRWIGLIKRFLNSGKKQATIRTDAPTGKVLGSARSAIRRLGAQDRINVSKRGDKVYLIRRA